MKKTVTDHRYSHLMTLITCIPYPDHKYLKHLMSADLNNHFNCVLNAKTCSFNCSICRYYNNRWSTFKALIDRVMTDEAHKLNVPIVLRMNSFIEAVTDCPHNYQIGECNGNCSSCGL